MIAYELAESTQLQRQHLDGIDLAGSSMRGADLRNCDLTGAMIAGATLKDIDGIVSDGAANDLRRTIDDLEGEVRRLDAEVDELEDDVVRLEKENTRLEAALEDQDLDLRMAREDLAVALAALAKYEAGE